MNKIQQKNVAKWLGILLSAVLMSGCFATGAAHRPIVDDNNPNYEMDLRDCQEIAQQREYFNEDVKSDAAIGSTVGALLNLGGDRGDIIGGAVVGALFSAGGSVYEARDERKGIVINCMEGRGYNVLEYNRS